MYRCVQHCVFTLCGPIESLLCEKISLTNVRVGYFGKDFSSGSPKGEKLIEMATRLDPFPPITFLAISGMIRWGAGKLDDAIRRFEALIAETPEFVIAQLFLTVLLIETGRIDEARTRASEVRRLFSNSTVAEFVNFFQDLDLRQRFVSALREAGLE